MRLLFKSKFKFKSKSEDYNIQIFKMSKISEILNKKYYIENSKIRAKLES